MKLKPRIIFPVQLVTSLKRVADSAQREAAQDCCRFQVTAAGEVNILTFRVTVCLITTETKALKDWSLSALRQRSSFIH